MGKQQKLRQAANRLLIPPYLLNNNHLNLNLGTICTSSKVKPVVNMAVIHTAIPDTHMAAHTGTTISM